MATRTQCVNSTLFQFRPHKINWGNLSKIKEDKPHGEGAVSGGCQLLPSMATSSTILPSTFILGTPSRYSTNQQVLLPQNRYLNKSTTHKKRVPFTIQAAKPPAGVEFPKVQPQFKPPFLGFTKTAEVWNSRASMIGLIGVFIVELIINKGILQVIGVEVGKGLNIPL